MKNIFLYLTLLYSFLYSNQVNIMIEEILSGKNKILGDEILLQIDSMDSKNDKNILILKGLVESNGEKSYKYFKDYIDSNINNQYNEVAISKVSEYYYTSGLYIKSSEWYKKLIMNYPNSKNLEAGINYFLNSLSVVGKLDSAKYYSKILHDKYPNLKFNPQFYDGGNKNNINNKEKKTKIGVNYSVEVALYETYAKAMSLKSILSSEGFLSRIDELFINNKKMYALRVGHYKDRQSAENIKKRIRSRLGLSNLIIIEIKI